LLKRKFLTGLLCIAGIALVLAGLRFAIADHAATDLKWAEDLYAQGKWSAALQAADRVIDTNPDSVAGWLLRGKCKRRLTPPDFEGSLRDFNTALLKDPSNFDVYNNRGITYKMMKQYDKAIADFNKATELDPKSHKPYYNRAQTWIDQGEYAKALTEIDRCIQIKPGEWESHQTRGQIRIHLKDFKGAIQDLDLAVKLNPEQPTAYYNRALAKERLGDKEGARADYEVAASQAPDVAIYADAVKRTGGHLRTTTDGQPVTARDKAAEESDNASYSSALSLPAQSANDATIEANYLPDDPDDTSIWNKVDTPWAKGDTPVTGKMPEAELISPETDFAELDFDNYRDAVMRVMENMRLLFGDMTPEEERRFEAKWAPLLDFPTPKAFDYLNKLNPLLARFLSLRSQLMTTSMLFDKAWTDAGYAAGFNNEEEAEDALAKAKVHADAMVLLKKEMDSVASQIAALGDPPNPIAAKHRARKRLEQALAAIPVVSITPASTQTQVGKPCKFTPKLENISGKLKLEWSFGDKATKRAVKPEPVVHSFAKPGKYVVTLRVTDAVNSRLLGIGKAEVTVGVPEPEHLGRYVMVKSTLKVKPASNVVVSGTNTISETMVFHGHLNDNAETGRCTIAYKWEHPSPYIDPTKAVTFSTKIELAAGSGDWTTSIHGFEAVLYYFKHEQLELADKILSGWINDISDHDYFKILMCSFLPSPAWSHGPEYINNKRAPGLLPAMQTWHGGPLRMPFGGKPKDYPFAAVVIKLESFNIQAEASYLYQYDPTGTKKAVSPDADLAKDIAEAKKQNSAADAERKHKEEMIATHKRNIEVIQASLNAWRAELTSAGNNPARTKELNNRIIDALTEIQREQDLISSIQTGRIVHTRSVAEEVQHAQLIESCYKDVLICKQIQENAERLKRFNKAAAQVKEMINLLSPDEAREMHEWANKHLNNKAYMERDLAKLKRVASVIHSKVQGEAFKEEANAMDAITTLEEIKFASSTALIVAAPYAAAQGLLTGSAIAAKAPSWIATGYGIGTGYIEGGIKQAITTGARFYSPAVDVALSAVEGYTAEEGGGVTGAAKHAMLTLILRKGCEMSANRIIKGKIGEATSKRTWKQFVEDANFAQSKKDGQSLVENYQRASSAFEQMVAKNKPAGQTMEQYLAQNAAELSKTKEGRALCEAMAQVESSYTAKMAINDPTVPQSLKQGYNRHLEVFLEKPVVSRTKELMKEQGWNEFELKQIRHSANRNKVGRDHDLAVGEEGWTPQKNGQTKTLAEFQRDLEHCLAKAYSEISGKRTSKMADWKGTTSVDPEAYLDKAVLDINKMREAGIDPLSKINPNLAEQTAGVNVFKVKQALGKGSREGVAEACRTLSKELDTKVLPFMKKGSAQRRYFERLKAALDKGSTDPRTGEMEVFAITGRNISEVSNLVAKRLTELIRTGM